MSTKRKPLPYAASYLVDAALMSLSAAHRRIKPLLAKNDLETVASAGLALDEINRAIAILKEAKTFREETPNVR
jgi:predicted nucleic acid-binding protein